ncbi:MAG: carboxypeptidase-like regulatory domain-containing protein, partial [Bacteroidales bacterium]|nr:carboxypeptidase-like regulatory domain-containing protein [Bacteroidales bacterium]
MKKYFALFGALVLAFGSFNYSHAEQAPQAMSTQLTNVSGTVVDENGEPVIGATITEVGTTRVTATDINGHFNLRASGKGKIEIAYVGYKTVTVNPGTNMNIKLTEDKALLDEVVVVGYGVQKKANLTGAVSNVDVTKT